MAQNYPYCFIAGGLDPERNAVELQFHDGSIYRYEPVDQDFWDTVFLPNVCRGCVFNSQMRNNGNIAYRKIDQLSSNLIDLMTN